MGDPLFTYYGHCVAIPDVRDSASKMPLTINWPTVTHMMAIDDFQTRLFFVGGTTIDVDESYAEFMRKVYKKP